MMPLRRGRSYFVGRAVATKPYEYDGRSTVGREQQQQQLMSYVWREFNHVYLYRVKPTGGGRTAAAVVKSSTAEVPP